MPGHCGLRIVEEHSGRTNDVRQSRGLRHIESYEADMNIDLSMPNVEPTVLPAMTARARQHRQRAPLRICRINGPMRSIDRTSIDFELVPEARQTYPAEDDRTTRAVARAGS